MPRALLDGHRCEIEAKLERLRSTHVLIKKKIAIYDRAIEQGRATGT